MKIKWFIILILVILVGCTKEQNEEIIETQQEQHVQYFHDYGWNLERFLSETKYAASTLGSYPEHVQDVKTLGHVDLTPYADKEVVETGYTLQGNTTTYNQIVGYIIESDHEVIGGYLVFNHEAEQADGTRHIDQSDMSPILHRQELGSNLSP